MNIIAICFIITTAMSIFLVLFTIYKSYVRKIYILKKEDLFVFEKHLIDPPKKMIFLTDPMKIGKHMTSVYMHTKLFSKYYFFKGEKMTTSNIVKLIDLTNQSNSAKVVNKFNL